MSSTLSLWITQGIDSRLKRHAHEVREWMTQCQRQVWAGVRECVSVCVWVYGCVCVCARARACVGVYGTLSAYASLSTSQTYAKRITQCGVRQGLVFSV